MQLRRGRVGVCQKRCRCKGGAAGCRKRCKQWCKITA